jgi:hypothetical protein
MGEYSKLTIEELKALTFARVQAVTKSIEICWGPDVPALEKARRYVAAIERAQDALIALGRRGHARLRALEFKLAEGDAKCGV